MRIALITSMKYGLTQFIFRDINALVNKGHDVRIFTLHNKPGLYNPLPGWTVVTVQILSLLAAHVRLLMSRPLIYLQLLSFALRTKSMANFAIAVSFAEQMQDVDLMYAYFGDHKFFVGYYCKRINGTPLLVTIRAYELYYNPNVELFKEALNYCDRILTITDYNKNLLVNKYGAPAERIDIVRQIVDLDLYRYEEKIKILIVGFFAEKKGHDILFQAFKKLDRANAELWVVGDNAPDRVAVDCRKLAKELQIEERVVFFGAQSGNALRALYRECDIFCLPSHPDRYGDQEGFPNVIAEAMAFGKPVVSTRHAGIPEMIDQILVDEFSVEQLVDALRRVCDDAALRQTMGVANRTQVEQHFSMRNNDRLEEILTRYAKRPSAPQDLAKNHEGFSTANISGT